MPIEWSMSNDSPRELVVSILGLAAHAEWHADHVAYAYIRMLPDSIAEILVRKWPLSSADQARLIRASVEREGHKDFAGLADDYDRLAQVRNDLAHSETFWVDRRWEDRIRLYNHRGRSLRVLPEIVTIDDLRREVDRGLEVRDRLTGLAYRLGRVHVNWVSLEDAGKPETGPGPRPVKRDSDDQELPERYDSASNR